MEYINMKRVITYGTYDLLHYGHINLLKRAKALGDYLIVAISTDEFNWNSKQKKCYFTYEQRKALVEAVRYVDLVIPEESWEQNYLPRTPEISTSQIKHDLYDANAVDSKSKTSHDEIDTNPEKKK